MKTIRYPLVLSTLLFCSLSFADTGAKAGNKTPCADDIQKYCSDVTPGEGQLAKCMKSHASELSASCKSYGKKYKKEHAAEVAKELSSGKNNS